MKTRLIILGLAGLSLTLASCVSNSSSDAEFGNATKLIADGYADDPKRDPPNPIKMTGIYIWKNALEATFTPVKDKTNTWKVVFVATDHVMTSRYEGTVAVDMDGGAASGTVGFAGGHRARTAAWTLEGTMQDGILRCTVDEVDGTEDCAAIELGIVKQHAKKEAVGTASVKLKGHYVFGKNNVVEATFTAVDGKKTPGMPCLSLCTRISNGPIKAPCWPIWMAAKCPVN